MDFWQNLGSAMLRGAGYANSTEDGIADLVRTGNLGSGLGSVFNHLRAGSQAIFNDPASALPGVFGNATAKTPVAYRPSQAVTALTRPFNYIDAPYSQAYGMGRNAAFQEALAGSSYQRAVADMQKAGLNPVLAAGSASGASSFGGDYSNPVAASYGSGSSTAKKKKVDHKVLVSSAGSLMSAVGTLLTKNPSAGAAIGAGSTMIAQLLDDLLD